MTAFASREQQLRIDYLVTENAILPEKIGLKRRLLLSDSQRIRLADKAKAIGRTGLKSLQTLFTPDTLLRWHRELCAKHHDHSTKQASKLGRPELSDEVKEMVLRLAKENSSWGYDRIVGQCANLGFVVSATSVASLLDEHGIEPVPKRGKSPTWSEFLCSHMDVLAAVDFTTIDIWSLTGLKTYYLLFFMEISTRRVHFAGMTQHPNEEWMMEAANKLTNAETGFLRGKKILLLDRDTKFTLKFREHLKAAGTEPIRLPPKSPNCNAFIERFFRSIKTECLCKMIVFGEGSLRSTVERYVNYYHGHRNHQDLNNLRIAPTPEEPITGTIDCEHELGGLLKHYHRRAA